MSRSQQGLLLAGILVCLLAACSTAPPDRPGRVGLTTRAWLDESRMRWDGAGPRPLSTSIWYPVSADRVEQELVVGPPGLPIFRRGWVARDAPFVLPTDSRLPLVVLSHGTGGSAESFSWLAEHLAARGYLVAGVTHHGNSIEADDLSVQGFFLFWERAPDISRMLDRLLADPEFGPAIDRNRIAAAGFSLGGNTVVLLAGAQLDTQSYFAACESARAVPSSCAPPPEAPFDREDLLAAIASDPATRASIEAADRSYRDERISAVYAIAPAVIASMSDAGIEAVEVPLRAVVGSADTMAPPPENAHRLARLAPGATLWELDGVDHYTFLGACGWGGRLLLGDICRETPAGSRAAVLPEVASDGLRFFESAAVGP